jgi:hypothetical protein
MEDAWQDALACHRLARLIAQGPMLVDGLVAIAIDGIAVNVDCSIAGSDRLTAEQARRFGRQFAELPPLAGVADKIRLGERFVALDAIVDVATSSNSVAAAAGLGIWMQGIPPRWTPNQHVDWDAALRLVNFWFDRMAKVAAITLPPEKRKATATVDGDVRQMIAETCGPQLDPLGYSDRATSDSTEKAFAYMLLSAELAAVNAEDRHLEHREMCRLAFALAAFRIDHGRYPTALSELVPRYIEAVPKDRFSGADLHFKPETDGYYLYGAGSDGNDPPLTDPKADLLQDHIGIRVPPKVGN